MVSGLPLQTKPFRQRIRLIDEAFELMAPDAPFVQFTYADGDADSEAAEPKITAHASELIWQNLPPARVWVYRKG